MAPKQVSKFLLSIAALAAFSLPASADGIGASLLTQQHPFYISLANAMTAQAKAQNLPIEVSIANQDLNKQLADVEDFITKGVDVIVISPVDSDGVRPAITRAIRQSPRVASPRSLKA